MLQLTAEQAATLKKVIDYSYSDERGHLEEHLQDELGDEADGCEELTDKELYDKYHEDVEHIWFDLYELSELVP